MVRAPKFCFLASMDQATRYSVQKRIKIVEAYFAAKAVAQRQPLFWRDIPGNNATTRLTIKRLLDKIREMGSVQNNIKVRSGCPVSFRTENHIMTGDNVWRSLQGNISTRHFSQKTKLSRGSVMRIMHQDLHLFPHKIAILQLQTDANKAERRAIG